MSGVKGIRAQADEEPRSERPVESGRGAFDLDDLCDPVTPGPTPATNPRNFTEIFRFSVVIPAFNEEMYLGDCLSSLQNQDYPGYFEIIVVDNNSSDQTALVAKRAGATVVFESVPGVCQARQRGTETAQGEIIISTDADTVFDPGWLSRIDQSFADNPTCVAVAGPCYFHDGPKWGLYLQKGLFGVVSLVQRLTGHVIYVTATNFAFRKDQWTGYDTRLTQGGDELDLLRKLQKRGRVVYDGRNKTNTSARRMEKGLLYNLTVSFFFYYILGYNLNRIFGRPILGMAPAFRRSADGSGIERC